MTRWVPFLASSTIPIGTLAFLLTAPHGVAGWTLLGATASALVLADGVAPGAAARVAPSGSDRAYTVILLAVGLLHLVNAFVLAALVGDMPWPDMLASIGLVGLGSAYAGGIVGHELVHRRPRSLRLLGRLLLWPTLYDHFAIEHIHGHHLLVATRDDPTTARFDEPFWSYAARSVASQLVSAWRIDPRSAALGATGELALVTLVAVVFGPLALLAWLLQALVATVLIAAVNYFDHWGLERTARKVRATDAWDSESWLSHHLLLGLSAHSHHHIQAARPYQTLAPTEASPKLPYGYLRMVLLVIARDELVRGLLRRELERRRLGPFAPTRP